MTETQKTYTVGPGGGGRLMNPAFNPQDSKNIFITCDMSSAFVSHDGGETFHSTPTWGHIGTPIWSFNPHDENIVYAVMAPNGNYHPSCIYISRDKGRSWKPLSPAANEIAGFAYFNWGDRGQVSLPVYKKGTFSFSSSVLGFYVHPSNANTIFVATTGSTKINAMIYQSIDGGKTWEVFSDLGKKNPTRDQGIPNSYVRMYAIGSELYVINNSGLYYINGSTRTGTSKSFTNTGGVIQVNGNQVTVIMIADHGVTFDTKRYTNAVIISTDFGKTWTNMTGSFIERAVTRAGLSLERHQAQNYAVTPLKISYRYLALSDDTLYIGFRGGDWRSEGIAKTTDGGESWKLAYMGRHKDTYAQQFTELGPIDSLVGSTAFSGAAPYGLATAAEDDNLVITASMSDAMMSANGGLTWRSLASRRVDKGKKPLPLAGQVPFWKTSGIEPAGQSILAVNPSNNKHHLAGWTDIGIMESFDGSNTWTFKRIKGMEHGNCHAIAFDPHNKGVVLVAPTTVQAAVGSNAGLDQGLVYVSAASTARIGGIARSTDSGATWSISYSGKASANVLSDPTNAGLPTRSVITSIVFDPINVGIVYTSVLGAGVYKSTDGGVSWSPFNSGIALQTNKAGQAGIVTHRLILGQNNRTLFVLLSDTDLTRDKNNILVRRAPAYYLDLQSQETVWTELNRPNGALGNTLISLEMDENGVIYAAPVITLANWNSIPFNGGLRRNYVKGGVYVSTDKGISWRQMYYEHLRVACIKVDSRNNNILYMTTHMGKVFMSQKGKDTTPTDWRELPGFNYYGAQHIFEDSINAKRIYVTSVGGGTWSLLKDE